MVIEEMEDSVGGRCVSLHWWPKAFDTTGSHMPRCQVENVRRMSEEEREYQRRHGGACCLLWMRKGKPKDGELERQWEQEKRRRAKKSRRRNHTVDAFREEFNDVSY